MKKFTITSLLLSTITIGGLYIFNIIEVTENDWLILPVFYCSLCLGYWFFGGLIGIWFFNFDPWLIEETPKEDNSYYFTTYLSYPKKEKSDDDRDFANSFVIGYLTDNPSLGGVLGGNMAGGLLGSSLDGDLFN